MKKRNVLRSAAITTALLSALVAGCGGDSPEKLIASGKDFLAKNDNKAAVIQLKNALQQNPNLGEARYLLGKALLESGDVAGAEVELRKALELKFAAEQTTPLLARALLSTGQAKKVSDEFSKVEMPAGEPTAALKTIVSAAYQAQGNREAAQASLTAALAAKPDYEPALLASARLKAAGRDFAGALVIVDGVLAKTPNSYEALLLKGSLTSVQGDSNTSLELYRKAVEAKPDYLMAHSAIITSLMQQGKLDEAVKQLDVLKKIAPKNPQTIYLDAQLSYQRKDYKAARELSQQMLKIAPNNPGVLQIAGAVEFQLGAFVQAESYLNKALQQAPEMPLARRLLIANYLRTGQATKASEALAPVLGKIDNDPALLALAGQTFLLNGDVKKAEENFSKATKLDPNDPAKRTSLAMTHIAMGDTNTGFSELEEISASDKGSSADLALISAYLRRNDFDKALKAIDNLEKKQPNDAATYNLRARTLMAKRDTAGARKSFEKALSVNPAFLPAALSLAAMDMADKKTDDARKRFESVLASDPKNIGALLALADLKNAAGGKPEEVLGFITKAVEANPTEFAPRLALIEFHLRNKDSKAALAAAQNALAAIPDKPELLDALGRTQQIAGDSNQALATYTKLAALQPASPTAAMRMAEIQLANKNKDEAAKSLRRALEIKPDLLEAQRGLIMLAMDSKKPQDALALARNIQKQRPKEAVGFVLEGDIFASNKQWPEAIAAYRFGLKQIPAPELAIKAHTTLLASGNTAEAEKAAAAWTKEHPKDITFRMHLGDIATAQKNYPVAAQHYRLALELQPNNALVLNNLAWVSGQLKLPKAIEYAEKANQLTPNQPPFMDTLAMLLADKGDTAQAIELLRKALSISPQTSAIQLNLAKVLVSSGRKDEARKELDALAKLGDKFPAQAEVSRLQKEI
jgi:putative PEP-CTERM system TPR-repeat lipoprotein